jgi:hypothetical protein
VTGRSRSLDSSGTWLSNFPSPVRSQVASAMLARPNAPGSLPARKSGAASGSEHLGQKFIFLEETSASALPAASTCIS